MGGKKITKKSLTSKSGPTHPNSRRAAQLQRIDHRTVKLQQAKRVRKREDDVKVERISSLIFLLPPDLMRVPDAAYLHAFIQSSFLDRHTDDIRQLESEQRPGRPTAMRLIQLRDTIEREKREYESAMDIPDLMNEANVRLLRAWNGDVNQMGLFRFVRISGTDQQMYTIIQKGSHKEITESDKQQQHKSTSEPEKTKQSAVAMTD